MTLAFPKGMKVGLVPVSGKPVHAGHFGLIERAATENDHVLLYVSLSDRKRKGELAISGEDMKLIWQQHLEGILPSNVDIEYGGSPVGNAYKQLGEENERFESGDEDVATYFLYSDPEDITKNFPRKSLDKYAGSLLAAGLIQLTPISRASTVNVSGTKMRELLASGEAEQFMDLLPEPLDDSARQTIWKVLHASLSSL